MTQKRSTPFKNKIPSWGWLQWLKECNLNLSLNVAKGLKVGCAKGLCPNNVAIFYNNLQQVYDLHNYIINKIWNCDESSAHVSCNGGLLVLAKVGSKSVHSIFPNEREWLLMLSYINAHGESIPNFYIFKSKQFKRKYIK
jgi:hypothetical protein